MAKIMELLKKPVVITPDTSTGQYLNEKYGGKVKVKIKFKKKDK